ncbi:MAG: potassium transporter [Muribaculaceae bacterium]|nr:potassium transporter [Muribaculaceae bacterium]
MSKKKRRDIRQIFRDWGYSYNRFVIAFQPGIRFFAYVLDVLAFIAAVVCIVSGTVFVGFEHEASEAGKLNGVIRGCQIIFILKVLFGLLLTARENRRNSRLLKWIVDIAILVTLPALIYPHPEKPWIPVLEQVLYNRWFIYTIVGAYAVVDFSYGINKVLDRRVNPSLMLATSFLFFIAIGSLVLMMPKCTVDGIGYIDSLFVSTSAICITGLTPVDVSATFTPFGLLVLSLMIQIGGLGVMTFTSFFALFFTGNNSVYSQVVVKDMIYSKTINSVLSTLLYILGFTLVVELIGAVCIFLSVHGTLGMSVEDELIFSGFHSLSAFCNAGFSNIEGGLSNPALLYSNQSVYIIASLLIFAGGIGFPILVNFKAAFFRYMRRLYNRLRGRRLREPAHLYDMNTKIAMVTTIAIFLVSSLLFFIFEYDNSLAGMSLYDKIVQSVFNSFVPRSSGFSSVNPAGFLNITIIMMAVLMWIGGGAQSTAGGIKVNTFAVLLLELKAAVTGRKHVVVYHRTIAGDSVRRAFAVVTLSILAYVFFAMVLVGLEPALPVKSLLYETASALFTVGSSLGVTPELGTPAKLLLCAAMFLGRVGIISMLIGFAGKQSDAPVSYPVDNVIIN